MEPVDILLTQLRAMASAAVSMLPQMALALVVVLITWVVARTITALIGRLTRGAGLRRSLQELFALFATILTWVGGIAVAAVILFPNLTPTSILAGLGIGSVAIGFAFKDIFENFLAGILILFRRAMRIGDFIEVEGHEGRVERITVRETYIRRVDGQLVILPNATLFKNPLRIITDLPSRRTTVICGVAYGEDVDAARAVIERAVAACESVRQDEHPIEIFAQEFADFSINFEVTWWTGSTPLDIRASRDEVVAAVKRGLDEAGIEIPFPYRTLVFKEPLSLANARGEAGATGMAGATDNRGGTR